MNAARRRRMSNDGLLTWAHVDMVQKKLRALAEGTHTDCTFMVGFDDKSSQQVHAFTSDLKVASVTFEAMLRVRPLTESALGPIRIKHIEPHIFKMLIEYISTCSISRSINLEDAVFLALAAEEYLIVPLKKYCITQIENMVTVETVWSTLNATCHILSVAAACSKVLCSETRRCVAHPNFLHVSQESLVFFLQLEHLSIGSEMELVDACIKLNKNTVRGLEVPNQLMRAALPHLRLLTLTQQQIALLSEYLTKEEKQALASQILFRDNLDLPKTLCPIATQRRSCNSQIRRN